MNVALAINWWHNYEKVIFQQYLSKSNREQTRAIIAHFASDAVKKVQNTLLGKKNYFKFQALDYVFFFFLWQQICTLHGFR